MTVEIRTNPPLVKLTVTMGGSGIDDIAALDTDPFNEMAGAAKANARVIASMPKLDMSNAPSTQQMLDWQRKLETWNEKHHSATSVFIDGLDERAMIDFIRDFQRDPQSAISDKSLFKGTRFGGANRSMCSIAARCLKEGLAGRVKVQIGVKFLWTVADVVRYGVAIREALEKAGTPQPNVGYRGARSGMLQNTH